MKSILTNLGDCITISIYAISNIDITINVTANDVISKGVVRKGDCDGC